MGTNAERVDMMRSTWGMTWLWVALSIRAGAHERVPAADWQALKRRSSHKLRHLVHGQQVKRGNATVSRTKCRTHTDNQSPNRTRRV